MYFMPHAGDEKTWVSSPLMEKTLCQLWDWQETRIFFSHR